MTEFSLRKQREGGQPVLVGLELSEVAPEADGDVEDVCCRCLISAGEIAFELRKSRILFAVRKTAVTLPALLAGLEVVGGHEGCS